MLGLAGLTVLFNGLSVINDPNGELTRSCSGTGDAVSSTLSDDGSEPACGCSTVESSSGWNFPGGSVTPLVALAMAGLARRRREDEKVS